jgi:hypothetical protein
LAKTRIIISTNFFFLPSEVYVPLPLCFFVQSKSYYQAAAKTIVLLLNNPNFDISLNFKNKALKSRLPLPLRRFMHALKFIILSGLQSILPFWWCFGLRLLASAKIRPQTPTRRGKIHRMMMHHRHHHLPSSTQTNTRKTTPKTKGLL